MKSAGICKGMVTCLALLAICLSGTISAAPPAPGNVLQDIALADGGAFEGQFVDAQGVPKAGQKVTLLFEEKAVAVALTDRQGRFGFRNVRGGAYQLAATDGTEGYRLWAPGTAPKGALPKAMFVARNKIVRGQGYYPYSPSYLGQARFLLANPWVVSGVVATAVAVPVGINNAGGGDVPASP